MAPANSPFTLGKGLLLLWSLPLLPLFAQRYTSDTLSIRFYSADAPIEKIQAENTQGSQSWIDFSSDSVYVRVRIRSFSFPNKLMEEHFNEKYMESERYPYAYFHGKLVAPFSPQMPGTYAVSARGLLTIHGVSKERLLSGTFEVLPSGRIILRSSFWIRVEEHGIKAPHLLWEKIAQEVEVHFYGEYSKKE